MSSKRVSTARTRAISALVAALLAAAALPGAAPARGTGLPPQSPSRTVECDGGTRGSASRRRGRPGSGPSSMLGKGEVGAHWNPPAKRFSSKVPIVIVGADPVTVRVPDRLLGRLALTYGGPGRREMSSQITFVPCAAKPATFFPGGMLFTRREPISLLVQPQGWARPRPLNLGVFPPD